MKENAKSIAARDPSNAVLLERLQAVEQQLADLKKLAEQHWGEEARRFALIDQFLDPAMQLDSLIKQLGELGRNQNQMIVEMQSAIERELGAMRSALRLSLGAAELEQARALGN